MTARLWKLTVPIVTGIQAACTIPAQTTANSQAPAADTQTATNNSATNTPDNSTQPQ